MKSLYKSQDRVLDLLPEGSVQEETIELPEKMVKWLHKEAADYGVSISAVVSASLDIMILKKDAES
jgi:hypothetical protein